MGRILNGSEFMRLVYDSYPAPFGLIRILMDREGVIGAAITADQWDKWVTEFGELDRDEQYCRDAIKQLGEYFSGQRQNFSMPLSVQGPRFSREVWRELLTIPFGETRSYAEIALAIERPKSYRAVGQANRRNRLPIFIPCHRVIGKDGGLTGYIGKQYLDIKKYLLEMEKAYLLANQRPKVMG